jgi:hypothetical protein
MKVTGVITKVLDLQTGTAKDGSEWKKQGFLVQTKEQYNNLYCFELFGAEKVDNFLKYNKVNDSVDVEFNVQTNEWQGKYYTSLQAWKVFKADSTQQPTINQPASSNSSNSEEPNDLPF